MKIVLLDDQLQQLATDTCGIFQLHFYKNLLDPVSGSKIIDYEFLTKKQYLKRFYEQIKKRMKKK